jgi:acetyl esterase
MSIDPQVKAYLELTAALGLPPTEQQAPEEARAMAAERAGALFGPTEDVHAVEDFEVDGVPVRLYAPAGAADGPIVVYFHGGGWVIGSLDTHDGVCRVLANRTGCRIAAVDYRLAPEHRFPAAVDDCWAVTRWAFEQTPRVAVAGDSAGGNLAAVMALRARDAGLGLAYQALVYPVIDHRFDTASYTANAAGNGLTLAGMRWYWDLYLGDADGVHPDASPLRAASLAGVAPALVVVCGLDVLRDEGIAYAERLRASGVPTEVSEYEDMIHGFFRMSAVIDRSRDVQDEVAAALRAALTGDPVAD